MIKAFGPDIWLKDHKLKVMGVPLGTRMTIIRLTNGRLWLHSPVPLDSKNGLEELGDIAYVVAPNKWHNLYLAEYPEASAFLAPGLKEKINFQGISQTLSSQASLEWAGDIDQLFIEGIPGFNETVFYHRKSKSLICTDIFFNMQEADSFTTKLYFKLTGTYQKFTISKLMRKMIKDKKAFKQSLQKVLEWDFDKVVMAHGTPITYNGHQLVKDVLKELKLL